MKNNRFIYAALLFAFAALAGVRGQDRVVNADAPDIKTKFGIFDETKTGVTQAFTAVHNFIQGKTRAQIVEVIRPGDYIDLASLKVEPTPYTKQGDEYDMVLEPENRGAVDLTTRTDTSEHKRLRLIVAGVDSFAGKNGNGDTPHIVFQFENIPVLHRMNPTDTNEGGYAASEMRQYLLNNFYPALLEAGVPDNFVWAVSRRAANGGEGAKGADVIEEKIWLPAEREMYGGVQDGSHKNETAANQGFLEYYPVKNTLARSIRYRKHYPGRDHEGEYQKMQFGTWYWLASPYAGSTAAFACITHSALIYANNASAVGGAAPAFCVY